MAALAVTYIIAEHLGRNAGVAQYPAVRSGICERDNGAAIL